VSAAKKISVCQKPSEFFSERIASVFSKQKIEASKEAEFYLVDLMARFMMATTMASMAEPLALQYLRAQGEQVDAGEKFRLFRSVGDTSLYVSGFFRDSLQRKAVDLDYYLDIGTGSYRQILEIVKDPVFRHLYKEMAAKFAQFADALAQISHETFIQNNQDLLRLYEVYIKTGSEVARKQLFEKGVPTAAAKPKVKIKNN